MEKRRKKVLEEIKKFWNFIWNDDSFFSWIVFLVVIFIAIKFVFFPTISFITGTSLPLAIVESCSMHHEENFDIWWTEYGKWYENKEISKGDFEKFRFKNGFTKGDIFLIFGVETEDINIGDIIIFSSGTENRPIIHRVVGLNPLQTKGDNNQLQFTSENNAEKINEIDINPTKVIGKVTPIRIPYLGWIKLIFFEPFRKSNNRGFCE